MNPKVLRRSPLFSAACPIVFAFALGLAWQPSLRAAGETLPFFSFYLNHSGESDQVLLNSLVEITISYSGEGDSRRVEAGKLQVEFITPEDAAKKVSALKVYRSAAPHNWVARIAPDRVGEWQWRAKLIQDRGAQTVAEGSFTVYGYGDRKVIPAGERPAVPFRVLYNNDLNNVLAGYPDNDVTRLIQASVKEVGGGVDVHLLSPSFTWVPMWQSELYPMREHVDWFRKTFGESLSETMTDYVLEGGDAVAVFIEAARANGQAPFLSMRLNDHHYLDIVGDDIPQVRWKGVRAMRHRSRFYHENPAYRLGDGLSGNERVLDWTIPEVRGHVLGLIHEVVRKYPIEGVELDFLRHASFFRSDVPLVTRKEIMTSFVREVRQLLDAYTARGEYRWLAVRAPAYRAAYRGRTASGLDLRAAVDSGVDIVTLSISYQTDQQSEYALIRKAIPEAAVYLEITHAASSSRIRKDLGWKSERRVLTTDAQIYTAAHLAYSSGLNGISFFNMAYYRGQGGNGPPFHVLDKLGDPLWLARQPQHYMVERIPHPEERLGWQSFRRQQPLIPGETFDIRLNLAKPEDGWVEGGRIRIHVFPFDPHGQWMLFLNGELLERTREIGPLYPDPYPDAIGGPGEYVAWRLPADLPMDGENNLEIRLEEGEPSGVHFIEIGLR